MKTNWTYQGKPFTQDMVGTHYGFVYCITMPNGTKYIGKKSFWSNTTEKVVKKGAKSEEQKLGIKVKDMSPDEQKARKKSKKVTKTSNWEAYYSSSEEIDATIKARGTDGFQREILQLCRGKGQLAYYELKHQLLNDALIRPDFLNGIINVRLHRNAVFNKQEQEEAYKKVWEENKLFALHHTAPPEADDRVFPEAAPAPIRHKHRFELSDEEYYRATFRSGKTPNTIFMKTPYDSTQDTKQHIGRVQWLLGVCRRNLSKRMDAHDKSKLEDPEKEIFDEMTPKLKDSTYGSDEYKGLLAHMKPALDHHYAHNSHHPEHYPNGVDGMSMLDLLEMLCDWKAAGERHANGSMERSLEVNRDRFKISPQLQNILENTVRELGWLNNN